MPTKPDALARTLRVSRTTIWKALQGVEDWGVTLFKVHGRGYRLVTPVSGAVVLETKQQYEESGLTPASQATVPTVPEPHEWAMIIVALATLAWLVWRRQPAAVA